MNRRFQFLWYNESLEIKPFPLPRGNLKQLLTYLKYFINWPMKFNQEGTFNNQNSHWWSESNPHALCYIFHTSEGLPDLLPNVTANFHFI